MCTNTSGEEQEVFKCVPSMKAHQGKNKKPISECASTSWGTVTVQWEKRPHCSFSIPYEGMRFSNGESVITHKTSENITCMKLCLLSIFVIFFSVFPWEYGKNVFGLVVVWKKRNHSLPTSFSESRLNSPFFFPLLISNYRI